MFWVVGLFVFLMLSVMSSLYVLDKVLCKVSILQIFVPSL